MKLLFVFTLIVVLVAGTLFAWTRFQSNAIEQKYPPTGKQVSLSQGLMHYSDLGATQNKGGPSDPVVLFVHGASGNLLDQQGAFNGKLPQKYRALYVDRPGYGYSERAGAETPAAQAEIYTELLDSLNIDKAVLVGHSLGSASVAAFAVNHPERVQGLVFLAPATHPWPGGVTWYYELAALPVIGTLFTETIALPVGQQTIGAGARSVFEPQVAPDDYLESVSLPLILRPESFRNNARDVAGLKSFVEGFSKRYTEIKAPTVVITGNEDDVVLPSIHSVGLERDIEGAELIVLDGMGHKPDYAATDTVIAAIEKVSVTAEAALAKE